MRDPDIPLTAEAFPSRLTDRQAGEEFVNTLTHGAGAAISAVAAIVVLWANPMPWGQFVATSMYAVSLVLVYTVSTVSHAVQQPERKHFWRTWDQGLIYLLIAGTYTPFVWYYLPTTLAIAVLTGVWLAATWGMVTKVVAQHRIEKFSSQSYLLLGWLPGLALCGFVPASCFAWILLGGINYSAGTLFLMRDHKHPSFHPIWHVFVMLASACHFYGIYRFTILGV